MGKDHPDTAGSYNNIGKAYYSKGDYNRALEYLTKALDIYERILSCDHPLAATFYNNIGGVYREQGDYDKALECYEKAYAIRKHKLGEGHPDTKDVKKSIEIVKKRMAGQWPSGLNL